MANSSTSWKFSGNKSSVDSVLDLLEWVVAKVRLFATSCCTAMRLKVSVPVLSTHITVAAPSASIVLTRLVSTRYFEIRHAPIAINTVNTTGYSSGRTDIANVMPDKRPCNQSPRVRP